MATGSLFLGIPHCTLTGQVYGTVLHEKSIPQSLPTQFLLVPMAASKTGPLETFLNLCLTKCLVCSADFKNKLQFLYDIQGLHSFIALLVYKIFLCYTKYSTLRGESRLVGINFIPF